MAPWLALSVRSRKLSNVWRGWSSDGWPKMIISSAFMLEGHVKAFVVVISHKSALGPRGGFWSVLLVCNPQGRLEHRAPTMGQNKLMMTMMIGVVGCTLGCIGREFDPQTVHTFVFINMYICMVWMFYVYCIPDIEDKKVWIGTSVIWLPYTLNYYSGV
jgi:hypothetical protein